MVEGIRVSVNYYFTSQYLIDVTAVPNETLYYHSTISASMGDFTAGGHWAHKELDHLNSLKLRTILLGLQSLYRDKNGSY